MSDRQKGLNLAVESELPMAAHGFCAVHIFHNIKKKFGIRCAKAFMNLAYASPKEAFDNHMYNIRKMNNTAADYVLYISPAQYSDYAFPCARYGMIFSNVAEQANAWL